MIHYSLTFPCGLIERVSKKGDATIVTANIAKGISTLTYAVFGSTILP